MYDRIPPRPEPPLHATVLTARLNESPPQEWRTIISNIDWNMPDVGRVPVLNNGHRWEFELLYVHPLSTLVGIVDDDTFSYCLTQAHAAQKQPIEFRLGGRNETTDLADWVATGVLNAVARKGSVASLKNLTKILLERKDLTSEIRSQLGYHQRRTPIEHMAEGSFDYARKIKVLGHFLKEQIKGGILTNSPTYIRRAVNHMEGDMHANALKYAIRLDNQEMVDALLNAKRIQALDVTILGEASSAMNLRLARQVAERMQWDFHEITFSTLKYNLDSLRRHALKCLQYQQPNMINAEDDNIHASPPTLETQQIIQEQQAGHAVCQWITEQLITLVDKTHRERSADIKDEMALIFSTLPAERVETHFNNLLILEKRTYQDDTFRPFTRVWLPSPKTLGKLTLLPDSPWRERIYEEVGRLDEKAARSFLENYATEITNHWRTTFNKGPTLQPLDFEISDQEILPIVQGLQEIWKRLPTTVIEKTDLHTWIMATDDGDSTLGDALKHALLHDLANKNRKDVQTPVKTVRF